MLWPEYVRRVGTLRVLSISYGDACLIIAHSASDMRETDAPVSISIVTQVPKILIVYLYGLTIGLSCDAL